MTWETFFLENHTQNMVQKSFPESFLKNQNWAYFWTKNLKSYTVCFYCEPSWGLLINIKTKLNTICSYPIESFFKKQKEIWNQYPCLILRMIFEEKYFSYYIPLTDQISLSGCLYFVRYWTRTYAYQEVTSC